MAITAADIDFLKSSSGTSDGGAESATEITSGLKNDLWPNLSDALRASGGSRTKKFYIKNNSGTETMLNPSVWITESPSGITVEIGLGAAASDDSVNTAGTLVAWSSNAKVALISSAADSRTATITGLSAAGDTQSETVGLTGTSEVLSAGTYSKVWGVALSALSGSATVTIKQGTGGTTRGTIGPSVLVSWLWVAAPNKASGIKVPSLLAGSSIPIWCRQTWSAGISAQRPARQIVAVEENS
jgi:hypothetical protein